MSKRKQVDKIVKGLLHIKLHYNSNMSKRKQVDKIVKGMVRSGTPTIVFEHIATSIPTSMHVNSKEFMLMTDKSDKQDELFDMGLEALFKRVKENGEVTDFDYYSNLDEFFEQYFFFGLYNKGKLATR